ncbi:MAG: hypothetical protein WCJ45_05495 [bacterium]
MEPLLVAKRLTAPKERRNQVNPLFAFNIAENQLFSIAAASDETTL